jgi:5-methylcytosine-specific restriction endonuclease McrA
METWVEYAQTVGHYDELVATACARRGKNDEEIALAYHERWKARLRHPSWDAKRADFMWYTNGHCEGCGLAFREADLQLHHLHYDTLWYENNNDLELLCAPCHRVADEERASREMRRKRINWGKEKRAKRYMELANRWSGQADWPVTYEAALEHIDKLDSEE